MSVFEVVGKMFFKWEGIFLEIIANVGKNILGSNIVLLFTEIDEAEIVLLFFLEYII